MISLYRETPIKEICCPRPVCWPAGGFAAFCRIRDHGFLPAGPSVLSRIYWLVAGLPEIVVITVVQLPAVYLRRTDAVMQLLCGMDVLALCVQPALHIRRQ